jgi:hypothetical protein
MAEAAREIWGLPYDSPNFQVAYNALLQMGIFADVQMEAAGTWSRRSHASFDEALAKVKHHFGLEKDGRHDEFLTDLLHRRLTLRDGRYLWPHVVRSALIYWDIL